MNEKNLKKPWPTKEAMQQVYADHLWGGKQHDFYSGEGSHSPELVGPYIDVVKQFLMSFPEPLSVCDLGCGDFHIGSQLVSFASSYTAIDIVPELIARNKMKHTDENLTFECLDIAFEVLPSCDCALVRQVLQHLSNDEVGLIVSKLNNYPIIILTEHIPNGAFDSNLDIISGQGIRLKIGSGVDISRPPFNFQFKSAKTLLSIDLGEGKGVIETKMFETE